METHKRLGPSEPGTGVARDSDSSQRPVARWEVEIQDSEAELGGERRVMAECAGRSVAQRLLYTI